MEKEQWTKMNLPDANKGNGHHQGNVIEVAKDSGIAHDMMSIGHTLDDAIGKTAVPDMNYAVAVNALIGLCEMFHDDEGLKEITRLLNFMPTIGGWNRHQGLQANAGVCDEDLTNPHLSKEMRQMVQQWHKQREKSRSEYYRYSREPAPPPSQHPP